jgi:hypothetical protein
MKGRGKSRLLKNLSDVLRSVASDAVRAEVAEAEAKRLQTRMRRELRPRRKTGKAESSALAAGSADRITIENIGYAKYLKGYPWARRIPYAQLKAIARAWRTRVQKALKGIR